MDISIADASHLIDGIQHWRRAHSREVCDPFAFLNLLCSVVTVVNSSATETLSSCQQNIDLEL